MSKLKLILAVAILLAGVSAAAAQDYFNGRRDGEQGSYMRAPDSRDHRATDEYNAGRSSGRADAEQERQIRQLQQYDDDGPNNGVPDEYSDPYSHE